jgi:hypothetical protein
MFVPPGGERRFAFAADCMGVTMYGKRVATFNTVHRWLCYRTWVAVMFIKFWSLKLQVKWLPLTAWLHFFGAALSITNL